MGKLPMTLISSMGNAKESPSFPAPPAFEVTVGNPLNPEYRQL